MRLLSRAIAVGTGLALLAGAATSSTRAAEPRLKLDIPFNSLAINMVPMWTALELKLFERYGIAASTEYASRSPVLVAAIQSGETPFAIAGEDAVIAADLNGGDIVLLVAPTEKLFFTIMAAPSIRSVADLKDKKIGITGFGTTTDFIVRFVLNKSGLESGRDVTVLPMGGQAGIDAGLEHGAIDAGVIGSNAILRPQQFGRFTPLASLLDYDLYFYTGALVAKKAWVAAHPSETLDVVRAYLNGIAATLQDKATASRALAKYTDTEDAAALDEAHKLLVRMLRKVPTPQLEAIRTGLAASVDPQAKQADPARFIDPSFVEKLAREGFIDALYKP